VFEPSFRREHYAPDPPVAAMIARLNEPLRFERAQQAADVSRIELEPFAQNPHVDAIGSYFVKKPCFA